MNNLFIIYVFLLFLLFIPNFIIQIPYIDDKMIQLFVLGLGFSILVGEGYKFLLNQKDGFTIDIDSVNGENPLAKLLSTFMNSKTPAKKKVTNYQINNKVDLSDPSLTEDDSQLQALKSELVSQQNETPITVEQVNQGGKENIGWVLSPIVQDRKYERTKQQGLYCGADFDTTTSCCGQPPANIPEEFVCPEVSPYCNGYVAFEKWGVCSNGKMPVQKLPDQETTIESSPSPNS